MNKFHKKLLLATLFITIISMMRGQDYTDIIRLNISQANLEDTEQTFDTDITNINFEILYPKILNENLILLSGLTVEYTDLNLFSFQASEQLIMSRINAGLKIKHSEKWSGTYVVLPKLASSFANIDSKDIQIGGVVLFDYQYKPTVKTKFGLYSSSENFGVIFTPLFGTFYRSPNKKFHVDAVLPIRLEANYILTNHFSAGIDVRNSVKSYNISSRDTNLYVQEESVRAAIYGSYGLLDNALLLRVKLGFDSTDYGVYASNDTVGAQILTFAIGGDDRERLNNEFDSNVFVGLDLIYRFDTSDRQ